MHDVLIIGARAAGASLALALAQGGLRVLLLDRAEFPSDTASGHYVHVAGAAALRRLGGGGALDAAGAPPRHTLTVDFGPVVITGTPAPAPDGSVEGFAPRRHAIDARLIEVAVAAGIEFLPATSFEELITDGAGRVAGAVARWRDGQRVELRARLVIGADGKQSRLARAVGTASYDERPAATCAFYSYWSGMDLPDTRLHVRSGHCSAVTETNDGLAFLTMFWPVAEFGRVRADPDSAFREAAAPIPWLAERLASGRREERFVGRADLDGFFRVPHGPGWALVGDAGYHKDPITAQGMTDAFLHAELLAEAVLAGLGGRIPLDAALAGYHAQRDALARPMYELTSDMARLAPPRPEMAAALGALANDPIGTSHFLGVMSGTVPVAEVFGTAPAAAA